MTSHKDDLRTRELSEAGKANWDAIFPPKVKERYVPPPLPCDNKKCFCTGTCRDSKTLTSPDIYVKIEDPHNES